MEAVSEAAKGIGRQELMAKALETWSPEVIEETPRLNESVAGTQA